MSTMQESLSQIESMLATLVGGRVTKKMGPIEFVHYAHTQLVKAMGEPHAVSSRRLKALHGAVAVFKDNYSSDESVNVPVFIDDTTALGEKSTQLTTPQAAANLNPDGQTTFEQGLLAKFQALEALLKGIPDIEEDDEEKRKAAAKPDPEEGGEEEEETEEKRAAAAAAAAKGKPPFPPKKPGVDDDAKEKTAKGVDVSQDGTVWPADLNDAKFVKDGTVEKKLDWGPDPA